MKAIRTISAILAVSFIIGGCGSSAKNGALIGAGGGAVVGAIIGKLTGNTAVGAVVGTAVGTTTGALIGKHMDKVKEATASIENAKVESVTDANGLEAVKVTFDSGILFQSSKSDLNEAAKKSLLDFAEVLKTEPNLDVAVYGHTDNTGSAELNEKLSLARAMSVKNYLTSCGANASQFAEVLGKSFTEPVADNSTKEGRQLNRRVEVYMYASKKMIEQANSGNLN